VPLSPSSSTVASDGAACITTSIVRRHASDVPTIVRRRRSASWARSARFSTTSDCFSSAFLMMRTTWARLTGLVTKSYAPSFIASTAVSTVPYAVISTTSVSGAMVLAARSRSMPPVRGIIRSVSITPTRCLRSRSRPVVPSVAPSTVRPSRLKILVSDSTIAGSSSTTSTTPASAATVVGPPLTGASASGSVI